MASDGPRPKPPLLSQIRRYKNKLQCRNPKRKNEGNDDLSPLNPTDVEPSNIFSIHHLNETACSHKNASKCKSVQRLALVLQFYQNIINEYDINGNQSKTEEKRGKSDEEKLKKPLHLLGINSEFGEHYSLQNILNDHIHCIVKHIHDLEAIYDFINVKCDLATCHGIKRNHRDRTKPQTHPTVVIDDSPDNISIMDIMDQIHCYLLHTFDVGFQLTRKEKTQINTQNPNQDHDNDDDQKVMIDTRDGQYTALNEILTEKRKRYKYMIGGLHRIQHSKFVTQVNGNTEEKQMEEPTSNDTIGTKQHVDTDNSMYSFGHRFYYWKRYENHTELDWSNPGYRFCDFYVQAKYLNIKDELLNNAARIVSKKHWDIVNKKVMKYLHCPYCKSMTLKPYRFTDYKLHLPDVLSLNNLISLTLYTDFTALSYEFSSSFRVRNKNESVFELKQRHANYYWWARTLRETVEFYGNDINESKTKYFWHGISQQMVFKSTISAFNCPTSTTADLPVATTFASSNGIILQLTSFYKVGSGGYYFNCNWTSAFPNENENLFVGGFWPLSTVNILNCKNGNNYEVYMHALNILVAAFHGMPLSTEQQQARKLDKRIILKLLNSVNDTKLLKKFDPYFMEIYDAFRKNTKYLFLDLFYLSSEYTKHQNVTYVGHDIDYYGYEFLCDTFLTKPNDAINSFVKVDVILKNLPNCRRIRIYYNGGFNETILISKEYLQTMYNELASAQPNTSLTSIEIKNVKLDSNQLLSDFNSEFEKINYNIWYG
eukprot:908573_1